ncbi:zinc finger CCCH domain-containing protein 23-like [Malania oleifera]|uniref:zinc finger CCCH domain-containing protein 23-like n=1 Tax=Malania oleifera TaxID=397392 RepID=UPI0025ADD85A|nr:zinc finger CCCH domain-containing protein 23-like [Malania oleifera]
MDSYEATKIVFSRIQALDPENASKITGFVLIQEHGEKEMIRLAFGPESLLHGLIYKAKAHLGLPSNSSSTPSTPSSPSPFNPLSIPRPTPLSQHSPSINTTPTNSYNLPSPLAVPANPPSPSSAQWHLSGFCPNSASSSPSYAAVVNGASNMCGNGSGSNNSNTVNSSSSTSSSTSSFAYCNNGGAQGDLFDEYNLQDHLSFLNDSSSSAKKVDLLDAQCGGNSNVLGDRMVLPYGISTTSWGDSINGENQNHHLHRRSLSLSDACFGSEDSGPGFGWKPCLYFARGFCKNGNSCKFLHGGFGDSVDSPTAVVGSPNKLDGFEQCQEMLRSKAVAQQQRLAAASQLMAGVSFPYNKCMNFLMNDTQRSAAAALMMVSRHPGSARTYSGGYHRRVEAGSGDDSKER